MRMGRHSHAHSLDGGARHWLVRAVTKESPRLATAPSPEACQPTAAPSRSGTLCEAAAYAACAPSSSRPSPEVCGSPARRAELCFRLCRLADARARTPHRGGRLVHTGLAHACVQKSIGVPGIQLVTPAAGPVHRRAVLQEGLLHVEPTGARVVHVLRDDRDPVKGDAQHGLDDPFVRDPSSGQDPNEAQLLQLAGLEVAEVSKAFLGASWMGAKRPSTGWGMRQDGTPAISKQGIGAESSKPPPPDPPSICGNRFFGNPTSVAASI